MKCAFGSISLSVLFLCLPNLAHPQGPTTRADAPLLSVHSTFVSVPVSFENLDGEPIRNIKINDIQLWDNDIPQKLSRIKTDDLPISLVILMQTGASARRYLSSYTDLPSLLQNLVGDSVHEITLITFDTRVEEIWHFPDRSDGLNYALTHQQPGDQGAAIKDAIAFGVRQLQAEPGRFRRIVLVLSGSTDIESSTSSQSLLEQLGSASTLVYSIKFPSPTRHSKRSSRHDASPAPSAAARALNATLRALDTSTADEAASLTGGRAFDFVDQRSFNSAILALAEHFRRGETFGFQPLPDVPGFHALKVVAPGLRVTARQAYWSKAGQ